MPEDQFKFSAERKSAPNKMTNPTKGKIGHITPRGKRLPRYHGTIHEHVSALMVDQEHIERVWIDPAGLHYSTYAIEGWKEFKRGDVAPKTDTDASDIL